LVANSPHLRDNGYFFYKTPALNAVLVELDMIFMLPWHSPDGVLAGLVPPDEDRSRREDDPKYSPLAGLYGSELRVHWPHCIGLPAWIAAFVALLYQVRRYGRNSGDRK
jgi:hypothetical protein